jgi:hypothetical protein
MGRVGNGLALVVALGAAGCTLDATGSAAARPGGAGAHASFGGASTAPTTTGEGAGGAGVGGASSVGGAAASGGAGGQPSTGGAGGGAGGATSTGGAGPGGAGGAGPCGAVKTPCKDVVPAGFTRVALPKKAGTKCGPGLDEETLQEWSFDASACACAAASVSVQGCLGGSGDVSTYYDDSFPTGSCGWSGYSRNADGNCHDTGYQLYFHDHFAAEGPSPGAASCTAAGAIDPAHGKSAPIRLCEPTVPSCDDAACAGGELAACVEAAGDVPCPAGGPYVTRHVVAANAAVPACPACACAASEPSCGATMTYAVNPGCTGASVTFAADGSCQDTSQATSPDGYWFYQYAVAPTAKAIATPPAGAKPTLPGMRTVCCAK